MTKRSVPLLLIAFVTLAFSGRTPPQPSGVIQSHQMAREGGTHRLVCPVKSDPPPWVNWYKDQEPINELWTRFKVHNYALKIRDVDMEDAGLYICKATNGFGSITVNFTLTVKPTPSLTADGRTVPPIPDGGEAPLIMRQQAEKMSTNVGSSIRLRCRTSGKPKPEIKWTKDGKSIDTPITAASGSTNTAFSREKVRWSLRLKHLRLEDSGVYRCEVSNQYGTDSVDFDIQVVEPESPRPELELSHPVNMSVKLGHSTNFLCKVKSEMEPAIRWLKKITAAEQPRYNNTIEFQGDVFAVLSTGKPWLSSDKYYVNKLYIPSATEQDSGIYACMGANINGYNYQYVYLKVTSLDDSYYNGAGDLSNGWGSDPRKKTNLQSRTGETDETRRKKKNSGTDRMLPVIIAVPSAIILLIVVVAIVTLLVMRHRKTNGGAAQRSISRYPKGSGINAHLQQAQQQRLYNSSHHKNLSATSAGVPCNFTPMPAVVRDSQQHQMQQQQTQQTQHGYSQPQHALSSAQREHMLTLYGGAATSVSGVGGVGAPSLDGQSDSVRVYSPYAPHPHSLAAHTHAHNVPLTAAAPLTRQQHLYPC